MPKRPANRSTLILILPLLGMLAACQTVGPTPYQAIKSDLFPYGYAEKTLPSGAIEIRFVANKHTDRKTIENATMLRAAEQTQKAGYTDFAIIDKLFETHSETTIEREIIISRGERSGRHNDRLTPRRFERERRTGVLVIRPFSGNTTPDGAIQTRDAAAVIKQLKNRVARPGT